VRAVDSGSKREGRGIVYLLGPDPSEIKRILSGELWRRGVEYGPEPEVPEKRRSQREIAGFKLSLGLMLMDLVGRMLRSQTIQKRVTTNETAKWTVK
jgi:hypothetical protein